MSTLLFHDDFNRANSSTVGNGWSQAQVSTSGHGVNANTLYLYKSTSAVSSFSIWRNLVGLSDPAVALTVNELRPDQNGQVRIGFGSGNINNAAGFSGYRLQLDGQPRIALSKAVNDVWTALGSKSMSVTLPVDIELRRVGTTIQALVDGQVVIEATDSSISTFPAVGAMLWTNNGTTRADDFKVWASADYAPVAPPATFRPRRQRMAALGGF